MTLVPVLVTVEAPRTPKLCAVPRADCACAVPVIARQATPSAKNAATRDGILVYIGQLPLERQRRLEPMTFRLQRCPSPLACTTASSDEKDDSHLACGKSATPL